MWRQLTLQAIAKLGRLPVLPSALPFACAVVTSPACLLFHYILKFTSCPRHPTSSSALINARRHSSCASLNPVSTEPENSDPT